jgi:UDP-GlcNAc:undecaprenyl-phosphate GlcNAc-1-phosphate transferase
MNATPAAICAAFTGAVVAVVSAHLLTPLARRFGFVDPPGARKLQLAPVPLVGGVAILAACLSAFATRRLLAAPANVVDLASLWLPLATMAVGLLDDRSQKTLSPGWKGLLTLAALAVALALAPAGGRSWFASGIALVALFALVHATNTIDHVDGLCAGCCALALFAAAGAAIQREEPGLAPWLAALGGGALGFLFLNFPRARVFLGDSGTLLLGGCLAWLWLHWQRPEVFLLATVPLADFLSVAWLRVRAGGLPWLGDRRHVTHRLIARGHSPTRAVLALLALQAAAAVCGGWLLAHPLPIATATATTGLALALVALAFVGVAPPESGPESGTE